MIVVLSPEFLESEDCDFHIKFALSLSPGKRKYFFSEVPQCLVINREFLIWTMDVSTMVKVTHPRICACINLKMHWSPSILKISCHQRKPTYA